MIDKPSRQTIMAVFRELGGRSNDWDCPHYRRYRQLEKEIDEFIEKCKPLQKLNRLKEEAYERFSAKDAEVRRLANALKLEYLAAGLTPSIKRRLMAIVRLKNKR